MMTVVSQWSELKVIYEKRHEATCTFFIKERSQYRNLQIMRISINDTCYNSLADHFVSTGLKRISFEQNRLQIIFKKKTNHNFFNFIFVYVKNPHTFGQQKVLFDYFWIINSLRDFHDFTVLISNIQILRTFQFFLTIFFAPRFFTYRILKHAQKSENLHYLTPQVLSYLWNIRDFVIKGKHPTNLKKYGLINT